MNNLNWEYEKEKRKILQDSLITDHRKNRFVDEIMGGLGELILKEPNKVQKKLNLWDKIKKMF